MQAYEPLGIGSGMIRIEAANFRLLNIIFNAVVFTEGSGGNKDEIV